MTQKQNQDRIAVQNSRQSHPFLERLKDAPLCLAHRGASAFWPENTLEAAQAGYQVGAHAWEFDVQLSRDGHPVVIHDQSLIRTTDVAERFKNDPRSRTGFMVRDFDLSEIQSLDSGQWFLDPATKGRTAAYFGNRERLSQALITILDSKERRIQIPSLRQALDLTISLGWFANIEIKTFKDVTDHSKLTELVYETVQAMQCRERVLISSFDMEVLKQLRKRDHQLALGVLADVPFPDLDFVIRNMVDADTYHCSAAMLGVGGKWQTIKIQDLPLSILTQRETLRQLRLKSIPALVYTVNDPADARALLEIDRVSIFSDDVQALLPVISRG